MKNHHSSMLKTLILSSFLATSGLALAQPLQENALSETATQQQEGKTGHHKNKIERMTKKLGLTDAQAIQVREIFDASRKSNPSLAKKMKANRDQIHALLSATTLDENAIRLATLEQGRLTGERLIIKAKRDKELSKVLTAEQMEQYKKMQGKHMKKAKNKGPMADNKQAR